ncbi:MAG: hypothetical protein ACRDZ8_05315, partial [Acidimicrobiales bacterium]
MGDDAVVERRSSRWQGMGAFPGLGIGFLVLSLAFLVVAALSPTSLQWTGTAVHATYTRDGSIHYTYHGQSYLLADPTSSTFHETTVFIDPSKPANAILDNPFDRVLDVVSVGGPLLLAALVFALGFRRRRRRQKVAGAAALTGCAMD